MRPISIVEVSSLQPNYPIRRIDRALTVGLKTQTSSDTQRHSLVNLSSTTHLNRSAIPVAEKFDVLIHRVREMPKRVSLRFASRVRRIFFLPKLLTEGT